jgi:hypothetical protein
MTTTGWRIHATETNQQRFAAAQTRLDDGLHPPGPVGDTQRRKDEKFTDWYDQAVLASAQDEFERQCDEADFDRTFPEPADGARIEWEGEGGTLYAAYRQDLPEYEGGSWWLYGSDERMSWRHLVGKYRLPERLVDVATLVEEGGS